MKRLALLGLVLLAGCPAPQGPSSPGEVVVYCAADREFAQDLLERFTKETGVAVAAKWDTEAAKTVGLAQEIEAERARPRASVFWCNEPLQAALLGRSGALGALPPDLATDPRARETWLAFAARARVLLVNTAAVASADFPRSVEDLARPRWKGRTGIANPLFGTASTHVAALVDARGEAGTREYLAALRANEVAVCAGNADVKNRVASGELAFGLTDTDDAYEAVRAGKPVAIVFPDQDAGGPGALLLPNALGVVKGGPNEDGARRLVAFLASRASEEALAAGPGQHLPLGGAPRPAWIPASLRTWEPRWDAVAGKAQAARAAVKQCLLETP